MADSGMTQIECPITRQDNLPGGFTSNSYFYAYWEGWRKAPDLGQ